MREIRKMMCYIDRDREKNSVAKSYGYKKAYTQKNSVTKSYVQVTNAATNAGTNASTRPTSSFKVPDVLKLSVGVFMSCRWVRVVLPIGSPGVYTGCIVL